MRRRAVALTILGLAGTSVAAALAITSGSAHVSHLTYFVSPTGNDARAGTSAARAWRTIARVNRARLEPGDRVLFRGGGVFTDTTLIPPSSGSHDAAITFGSYGRGTATLANRHGAVWFSGRHDLVFDHLRLTSRGASAATFAGSEGGRSTDITLRRSVVTDTAGPGVIAASNDDTGWLIDDDVISHTGDSGVILAGADAVVRNSTIFDTGRNASLGYDTHGIYAKGPNLTITGNDISHDDGGQAISLRFHGARVVDNWIHDTRYAVGFFDDDTGDAPQGTSWIMHNRLTHISGWAFFYSGQRDPRGAAPTVAFVISSNDFRLDGAREAVDVSQSGSAQVELSGNTFAGSYRRALLAGRRTTADHNDWKHVETPQH